MPRLLQQKRAAAMDVFDFNSFQSRYKYRVGGQLDTLLSRVGVLTKDDQKYSFLKASRTTELHRLNEINATETDPAIAKEKSAKVKIEFLERSARSLTSSLIFRERDNLSSKSIAFAISSVLDELKKVAVEYTENTTDSTADQDAFLARITSAVDRLQRQTVQTKGALRTEGTFFNVNLTRANRVALEIEAVINTFVANRGSASAATQPDGSGVDVTV